MTVEQEAAEGPVAELVLAYGQYILSYPEFKLEVRGKYPDWVLAAGSEILAHISKMAALNELDLTRYARDEDDDPIEVEMDVEYLKYQMESRYESVPQCGVTYDGEDYLWVAEPGRADDDEPLMKRIIEPEMKPRSKKNGDAKDGASSPAPAAKPAMAGGDDFDMEAEMAKLDDIPGLD